jgi:NAD(P)H-dependent flavin oxidoreductase YrpB (nitropropane dioxygenase family)
MAKIERPWIAYKILAAGAIHPRHGFRHAFENGADFALVGMFDFQVAEDVAIAKEVLAGKLNRQRKWLA